jgi:hypothetical protein
MRLANGVKIDPLTKAVTKTVTKSATSEQMLRILNVFEADFSDGISEEAGRWYKARKATRFRHSPRLSLTKAPTSKGGGGCAKIRWALDLDGLGRKF